MSGAIYSLPPIRLHGMVLSYSIGITLPFIYVDMSTEGVIEGKVIPVLNEVLCHEDVSIT
jgi:hypothetical protein